MKKQPEITEKTKLRLKESFWELYSNIPIHKITVHAITEKAGYNRSTFYEYFIDVYDVLENIEDSLIKEIVKYPLYRNFSNENDTPVDVGMFFDIFEKFNKYFSILLGEKGDPSFQIKLKKSIKPKLKKKSSTRVFLILWSWI